MKLTVSCVALCCIAALFAACKKDKKNDNYSSNAAKMLEAGKWQLSAETATLNYMGRDTTIDLYAETDECDKDDFILFANNGTCTIDENTNKCSDDNQIEHATWALLNNDTRLALVDSNPDTFDVDVTSVQFKIKLTKPNSSGTPVTYISTYKNIK